MQVLGTVLIWARYANATKVDYCFDRSEPFRYFDEALQEVESEFVQPPEELRPYLAHVLFLNAIDGHPLIRRWRRLLVRLQRRLNCQVKVLIGEFVTAP